VPEWVAGVFAVGVSESAGWVDRVLAVAGPEPVAHAHSGTLPEPVAAHGSSNPEPRACSVTGSEADPKPRTES
jgi:hypothetical protein